MSNQTIQLVDNRTNKIVNAIITEGCALEVEELKLCINDPCYALFMFHHKDAPNPPNTENVLGLLGWYEDICENDDLDRDSPGEIMIGATFDVFCWKDTEYQDSTNAITGQTYKAEIIDFFGFGTDGFFIKELDLNIDVATDAVNHFVIA